MTATDPLYDTPADGVLKAALRKARTLTAARADRADVIKTLEVAGYAAALLMEEDAA